MGKKIKLRKQMKDILYDKFREGIGRPKHAIKDEHNATPYIHSRGTYDTYVKRIEAFANWCKIEGITTMTEARNRAKDYLAWLENDEFANTSNYTISTAGAALAKVFDCRMTELGYGFPKRERVAIKRSRYAAERDKHVSRAQNEELIEFCKSTGLRRSEVTKLRGEHKYKDGTRVPAVFEKDELWYVRVVGKGGKYREVEITGSADQIARVVERIKEAGAGKVWSHVHSMLDIHALRADYALRIYTKYARDTASLPKKELYICRGDRAGEVYDREAMAIASKALGHSRIEVIATNYLWKM